MKIAINAIRVSRRGGGGLDHYMINLVNEFALLGIGFDLFTVAPHHFREVDRKRIKNPKFIFGDTLRLLWTQIIFPFYLYFMNYDLVFSPSQIDALPFPPIKQVIAVLDLIPFLFKDQKHKHRLFLKYLFPIAIKKASHIIAISENTKKDVLRLFSMENDTVTATLLAKPQEIIRMDSFSVDELRKKYHLGPYVFCLSNNDPHKNLARLIEAFSKIKNKTSYSLVIAGYQNIKFQADLDKCVKELGLFERVKFLGHVRAEELPALYKSCEVFIYPSLYEGFGLPPLEAISYGAPTMVSQTSSLPEVIGEGGLYFNPLDTDDLADKMLQLILDKELRLRLKKLGIKQAQLFSWEKTARQTIKVFERVTSLN